MKKNIILVFAACILITSGCAPRTKYNWSGYDQKLYNYYKNPADLDRFAESLRGIISKAEKTNKVPPGLYAEYGFVLYEKNQLEECQLYFQKEQDKWPESQILMTKMIYNAQQQLTKSSKTNVNSDMITLVQGNEETK